MLTMPRQPTALDSGRQAVPVSDIQAFARSAEKLGAHAQWWEVPGGVRAKLFDFMPHSAAPRSDHKQALDDAAEFLRVSPHRRVWIVGHAEAQEGRSEADWQRLSERRARQVWLELAGRKILRAQVLDIGGHGVLGAAAVLSLAALASPRYTAAGYNAGEFRMVELLLMNMAITQALEEQRERLQNGGYNL